MTDSTGFSADLETARNDVIARLAERQKKGVVAGSVEASQLKEDQRRLELLNALGEVAKDPTRAKAISDAASAQMAVAKQQATSTADQAQGVSTMSAANTGMLGSSGTQKARGTIAATKATAVNQAATGIADWENAQKESGASGLESTLAQVLAPTGASTAVQASSLKSLDTSAALQQKLTDVEDQYRGTLANALGGFLNAGVTPAVTVANNNAATINANNRSNYQLKYMDWSAGGRVGAAPTQAAPVNAWSGLWQ